MITILLTGVLPIFAIAAIGYLLGKQQLFDVVGAAIINRFVFTVALPAFGFGMVVNAPFATFEWRLLIGFFISEILIYAAAFLFARKVLGCELNESILLGLAASFGNHVLFVLPIAISLFGDLATAPIIAIATLDSIVIFGGTACLMEALTAETRSLSVLIKKIVTNPPIASLIAGAFVAALGIDMPKGINVYLEFVGAVAAPCALFSLGVVLSQTKLSDRISTSIAISTFKLVGLPVVAWLILSGAFGFSATEAKFPMMVAAAPCGAMAFVLALNYRVRVDAISTAILITMLGSVFTVAIMAAL